MPEFIVKEAPEMLPPTDGPAAAAMDQAFTEAVSSTRAAQLSLALSRAQGEFTTVRKDKTARVEKEGRLLYTYKFADWSDMLEMLRPVLTKHELAISQIPKFREGKLRLVTQLLHASGGMREDDGFAIPEGLEPQKLGAYMTYYKRIAGSAMLGISAEEDTDAPPEDKKDGKLPTGLGKRAKAGSEDAEKPVSDELPKPAVRKMDKYQFSKEDRAKLDGHINRLGKDAVKKIVLETSGAPNTDALTKEQWGVALQKLDQTEA
jgi:ERF superfamily protein